MARVFIVGSGVVGRATGRGLARGGHDVTFIDVSSDVLEALRAEGFDARDRLDLTGEPDSFVFLTLPTPATDRRYELSVFDSAVRTVGEAMAGTNGFHTVVVRSTVPPGTTQTRVAPLLEEASGKSEGVDFAVAANPEFLRAASATEDFLWPWMTVIGARSKRTSERLRQLLRPFGGELRIFDSATAAELVKCAHNIYNAAKISFWNEMWLVSEALRIDAYEVSATVARSAEGSFNPEYGIKGGAPFAGACLPKDTEGFLGFAADAGVDMPLLSAVVEVNERMRLATSGRWSSADEVIDLSEDSPRLPKLG